ncbi:hypothetical protein HY604_02200 [Candidatus Peregrinibacteria bacterium]|nr:hypothetical protein [Candidatus Peregrinibacteria bacterium]
MYALNIMSGVGGIWMGWHIHMLFGLSLTVGLILFVIWAYKALKPAQLAQWALWLVIVGLVGALLTSTWGGKAWTNMMGNWRNLESVTDSSSAE